MKVDSWVIHMDNAVLNPIFNAYLELLTKLKGIETMMGADKRRFEESKGLDFFPSAFIGVYQCSGGFVIVF